MSYHRYWDHGHYPRLLSWAVAQKVRGGMTPRRVRSVYGFDNRTVAKMLRRAET